MKKSNFVYHVKEGFHNIFTHGLMSFAAVSMIVACLLIMGSFSLLAVNFDSTLGDLEAKNEFTAYMNEHISQARLNLAGEDMAALENVSQVTFVDREQALEDYVAKYSEGENGELFESLPSDVLRHRYRINVYDLEMMAETVAAVQSIVGVENVQAALDVTRGFVAVRNVATVVAVILVAVLLVISFFIISNTTRLAIFYRQDEIAIMKMCGASNWFVRWPFVIEGIFLGLFGATLAFLMQWGVYEGIIRAITEFGGMQFLVIVPFQGLWMWILGVFAGAGLVIGGCGSFVAMNKFLKV